MAAFAVRQIPKVLKTEQKQSQKATGGPVSLLPGSAWIGSGASAGLVVEVRRDGTLVIHGNHQDASA